MLVAWERNLEEQPLVGIEAKKTVLVHTNLPSTVTRYGPPPEPQISAEEPEKDTAMTRSDKARLTRREMIKRTAAGAGSVAGALVLPGTVLGRDGGTAPSERIGIGSIGVGAMGQGHFRRFADYPDVQLVACCDVDTWRRDHSTRIIEQVYGAKQPSGRFHGFQAYNDFRELLDRSDIDAVIVSTGERWHPAISVRAAKAGKDIYCEKPISLTIRQARTMVRTVRRHNRVFQTGLQQRNSPEFRKAFEMIHAGRIGEVKLAYVTASGVSDYLNLPAEPMPAGLDWDLWLGPSPWHPYNYRYHHAGAPQNVVPWSCNRAFGAGDMTSGLVHGLDSAHAGLQKDGDGPVRITPAGIDGAPSLTFTYADGTRIVCATRLDRNRHFVPAGWDTSTPIVDFGVLFVGDRGWIHVQRQGLLNCYPANLLDVEVPKSHSVVENHRDWLDCIRTRRRPRADVEIGACSTILSHLGCIAVWTGRALSWDPVKEEFLDDHEANSLRAKATREPWSV
jgi:hypothetical protein